MKLKTGAIELIILAVVLACISIPYFFKDNDYFFKEKENVEYFDTDLELVIYTYEELKEKAEVIAKVEVLDVLSEDNCFTDPTEYSLRNVKVIDLYKNELNWNTGDTKKIQERSTVTFQDDKKVILTYNGDKPLEKGKTYILFLSKSSISGEVAILSDANGKVDMKDDDTEFKEIRDSALKEFK